MQADFERLQSHLLMLMPCTTAEDQDVCQQIVDQAQRAASRQLKALQSASSYIVMEAGSQVEWRIGVYTKH